ncbi:MAG: hypothetical protein U1D30_03020 [Planctomycetota bacterium]
MVRLANFAAIGLIALPGCMQAVEDQTKPTGSIIGKKTDDIGEFDPNANKKVSDSQVKIDDPVLGSLQAYGPMLEQISKTYIDSALNVFHALNGRYPKDHKEFMEKIIKENNIKLPVLPGGKKYEYDVPNHKLVVVDGVEGVQKAEP